MGNDGSSGLEDGQEHGPGDPRTEDPFLRLLEVQRHDSAIDQLHHRLETLPERRELADLKERMAGIRARAAALRLQQASLAERQREIDEQVEAAKNRKATLERRLYEGNVSSPRDLQAMDEEVRHLSARVRELEDKELEVMEEVEPVEAEILSLEGEVDALDSDAARLMARLADAESAIEGEVEREQAARMEAAAGIPASLMERYEAIRRRLGGVGAAELVGSSCGGCHLSLPAVELDRMRKAPADELLTCDNCGRILIRR